MVPVNGFSRLLLVFYAHRRIALAVEKVFYLAAAGAAGTLARYFAAGLVHRINGVSFPWGTMVVNIVGCFLAGLLWSLFENRWAVFGEIRIVVFVGFMGAFTTFSSLILETNELLRSAEWMYAVLNITLQNGLGFVALFAGMVIGKLS
ncbi:MAG: CrcB family protein [Desulfosarcinaceae bacterium]